MIVIRVELHSAVTGKFTEIARMLLWNDGTGDDSTGHYKGVTARGRTETPMPASEIYMRVPVKTAEVKSYPRKRLHVWHLVSKMLQNMGYR